MKDIIFDPATKFDFKCAEYFVYQIGPKLRMPMENVHYPTTENISYYTKMITKISEGEADICFSSPGWTGHMAFSDPIPEFFPEVGYIQAVPFECWEKVGY